MIIAKLFGKVNPTIVLLAKFFIIFTLITDSLILYYTPAALEDDKMHSENMLLLDMTLIGSMLIFVGICK